MKPKIGISEKNLNTNAALLSTILADEVTLYIKTRKYHWNVKGESFMELHKLFQDQYVELEEIVDLVAERINKLGHRTIGTMKEFLEITRLKESPDKYPDQSEMIKDLLEDHEAIISFTRNDIEFLNEKSKDFGSIDFITGILEQHESISWVLRRYLN
jgi:starvation-inducible DNA-binding protein